MNEEHKKQPGTDDASKNKCMHEQSGPGASPCNLCQAKRLHRLVGLACWRHWLHRPCMGSRQEAWPGRVANTHTQCREYIDIRRTVPDAFIALNAIYHTRTHGSPKTCSRVINGEPRFEMKTFIVVFVVLDVLAGRFSLLSTSISPSSCLCSRQQQTAYRSWPGLPGTKEEEEKNRFFQRPAICT
jgi:hypothetical protein